MRSMMVMMLLLSAPLHADEAIVGRAPARELDAWSVNAAYFGETVLHPGVTVGVERKLKFWGRRYGLVEQGFFGEADVGVYWHARYDVAFFVLPQLGYRLVLPRGFRLEALLGLGYLHTFADGTVYQANGGTATTVDDRGHAALMTSAMLGVGWDFTVGNHAPFSLFLRAGIFGQYPYNTAVLPHLQAQLGFSIPLGRLARRGGVR
jgi:hypothetical protein